MSNNKRLLITGSEGIIGNILVRKLDGYDILRLDSRDGKGENYICADISNNDALTEGLKNHLPISCIVHLAADSAVDASWESVLNNNLIGTRNVLDWALRHNVGKVVFASSNHATGLCEPDWELDSSGRSRRKISPTTPVAPDSYYAVSKAFGEALGRYFAEKQGVSVICLRIGTVLKSDDPRKNTRLRFPGLDRKQSLARLRSTWLSHGDLVQLVDSALREEVRFGIYYGISDNAESIWDISNARRDLKYRPKEKAEERFSEG